MIKNRILYGILLILTLVFCYFKGGIGSSLLAYPLIFLTIICLIHVLYIYSKFTYTQEIDKKFMTKGERIQFNFSTSNETSLFYPNLEVEFYGIDSILIKYFETKKMCVPAKSKKTFRYEIECKYRGCYEIGIHKVYITDFLGIFRMPYKVMEPKEVTVYPKIVVLEKLPIYPNAEEESEMIINGIKSGGGLISDVREYAYGDSMHKVHWKLSAKEQKLMVKSEDATAIAKVYVVLDLVPQGYLEIEAQTILEDKLVECAVAVLYYCLNKEIPTTFCYFQKELRIYEGKDLAYFYELYELLFKMKFQSQVPIDKVFEMIPELEVCRSYWIGITSNLNYELYDQVNRCISEDKQVILIFVNPEQVGGIVNDEKNVISEALIRLGAIYYEINIDDELNQVLNS